MNKAVASSRLTFQKTACVLARAVRGDHWVIDDEDGADLIVSKPTGDEERQAERIVRDPDIPSQKDIGEHDAGGRATYRTWCEACVGGRGVGEPHVRGKGHESRVPILAFDYLCITPENGINTRDGLTLGHIEACQLKFHSSRWMSNMDRHALLLPMSKNG